MLAVQFDEGAGQVVPNQVIRAFLDVELHDKTAHISSKGRVRKVCMRAVSQELGGTNSTRSSEVVIES
jgi:hypothetical protein